ncbi:M16 family metallopeptidase [Mucilaginibacter ginkgonis]|uniref:Insulinase family protein n=1 Tax=Mucilaginibacter ginkgonis TaxID=2682091 RepID=A0A6I4IN51_9SPHI|nr:pitrilysin family protein [Mucilaginibacter ginkgonis]QQL49324.1 insulinase family protein [Mucilaginibacter ginkgonis]
MEYQVYTLPNGLRLLHHPVNSNITHCCIVINAGSRDEKPGQDGLAHFIEHLIFKHTKRRNTSQILNRLELVGADLNAYTTKEYTCVHASFLNEHLERTLDLFEDIVFHSTFPENEIEKERGVILDEIASYLDQPEEAIQDDFEGLLFEGHSMGCNILGAPESVSALSQQNIKDFIAENYLPSQIVIGVSGKYPPAKLTKLAEKYFGHLASSVPDKKRVAPPVSKPQLVKAAKPINQTHCIMGLQAYPSNHPLKSALLLLNNLLGGMGMSSRLNMEIREKYGIAYTIESSYVPFTDTGIFNIYFGTDAEKAERALKLVGKELKKLRDNKLGTIQLQQAKQKFCGQIALAEEGRMSLVISMTKSLLDFNRVDSLDEVMAKINAVTADELLEISNELLDESKMVTLIFEPEEETKS